MTFMALSFSSPLSIYPPRPAFIPLHLPSHHFPALSPKHRISIQCATRDNTEANPPAASTQSYDPKKGVPLYKPKSYDVLVTDAANSLAFALQDGKTRLEIDFPPLPSNISSYKGSSDEFIDANIQLALAVVRKLQQKRETRACIVFPDKPEKRRASQLFKTALDSIDGISIGSLDDVPSGAVTTFFKSIKNTLDFDFQDENEGRWEPKEPPTLYIFINCSTRELSVIEKRYMPCQPQHFYSILNLTLCVLTWVFWDFLPKICTIDFFLNSSQHSIYESGSTPRICAGPWQVMLKQSDGSYACVAESATRFTLGETKEELLRVLGLQEEQGSQLEFLRRGYKKLGSHLAWDYSKIHIYFGNIA
ncbi:PREDICTED: protein LOW PSII ACCUMULATION 3, chloroplastic isoform X4 [Theobroma cacao]|uniref:Protein LOW PSII ACCUMULATION 3, chloroplastic isoform X4 n=1 Tax=Theobroma cacao TaxID=3641 RepID=A0AB32WIZ2_THECC|nr:PREDICTED: protein LOW PSII ACCUMULATION 3, chloroplastic isoform X4 [Theobroma cacao]